ncbi:MAG: glycosyltransferase family 4 protein [Solobacterium sp.]|nr:glycosyltransferase family 4 protein [Solobacterium sp.]
MKKVLFAATVVRTHIMQFHIPYLKMLKEMGYETFVAARNDYADPAECIIPYCDHYIDIPFERNPLKPANRKALEQLRELIDREHFDLIHCHTPVGAMLTRIAARNARKQGTTVIYTVHGLHFYKGAPLINWLAYYPVEKHLSRDTDVLITINKEDYEFARTHMNAKETLYVPGVGIDTERLRFSPESRRKLREELGLQDDFILLSIGELIKRKNHRAVLDAIAELKNDEIYPRLQYLISGSGVLQDELKEHCRSLGIEDKVHFLGYRHDIPELCSASDLFLFMSLQEGLPVALMEAMSCSLPAVCTAIRGNTDLVEDGINGRLSANDPRKLAESIKELYLSPQTRTAMGEQSRRKALDYDQAKILDQVREIYLRHS